MILCRLAVVAMFAALPTASVAQDLAEYLKFRQERFPDVQKANPEPAQTMSELKARTAAAIATAPKLGTVEAAPVVWEKRSMPFIIYDVPVGPRMVVVPAGEYSMGSPVNEAGRSQAEGPRHRVRMATPIAVSMFPVTFAEILFFAAETGHQSKAGCAMPHAQTTQSRWSWKDPGFAQNFRSPAVCISFADAQVYADWLSRKTGHRYRLLSEAEYEYVQRAGTASAHWWGDDANAACAFTNGLDLDAILAVAGATPLSCRDGFPYASELGKTKPNAFGLYDIAGNVASWTRDCWTPDLRRRPANGAPVGGGDCRYRAVRGGSWATPDLRSASRRREPATSISADLGFRIAREL